MAAAAALVVALPLPDARASTAPDGPDGDIRTEAHVAAFELRYPARPAADRYTDPELGLSITPPAGWIQSPPSEIGRAHV